MSSASNGSGWPNFLIIGAAKSGTTALYHQLAQHPEIFMSPVKEPAFFALEDGDLDAYQGPGDDSARSRIVTTVDDYLGLFDGVRDETAIGEASVVYLYHPEAPLNIKRRIPDVRLIAILRDPVERAFSNYLDNLRHGFETESTFAAALALQSNRAEAGWSWYWRYRDIGFYGRQLKRYFDLFDHDQIRVHFYEDYRANPGSIVRDIFDFLGVDPSFEPDLSSRHNVSGPSRSPAIDSLIKRPSVLKKLVHMATTQEARRRLIRSPWMQRMLKTRPELPESVAAELARAYESDIKDLEKLTGHDLQHWMP